jgi:PPOX class probable F420-dependent enzyme
MELPDALAYVRDHHRAVLATARADGRPQLSPVVTAVVDGMVSVSSREPLAKVRNLRRDPQVSITVFPDQFFGPWVQIDGAAEIVALPEAMDGLIAVYRAIAGEHPDWDEFRAAQQEQQRVLIRIRPERASGTLTPPPSR